MQTYDMNTAMRQLELARPAPSDEEIADQEALCLNLLVNHDALDVAPLLGLIQ